MFYRVNGIRHEAYRHPSESDDDDKTPVKKFPMWLLILILVIMMCVGLGFLFIVRKKPAPIVTNQDFGFKFY